MGTIDVPIFYGEGDDLMEWVCWINDFCFDQGFSDYETLRFAYGFIEGEALDWYHEESSRSLFKSWANLKYRLVMRFTKRPSQQEVINRQEQLRQISLMLDRWDEEDEAKKQQEKEMKAAGGLNQILSFVDGFVKSSESAPSHTVSEEEDDLILSSNQLIPEVKNDIILLECPVLVQEKDETKALVFEDDNISEMEIDDCTCQVFDQMPNQRQKVTKKKKRWKATTKKKNRLQRRVTRAKRTVLAKRWMWKFTKKSKKKMKLEKLEKKFVKSNKGGSQSLSMRQRMKEYERKRNKHKLEQKKLRQGLKRVQKKLEKWMKHKFKQKNYKDKIKLDGVVMKNRKLIAAKMIREASRQILHMSQVINKKWLLRFIERKKRRMKSATWKRRKLNNKHKKQNDKTKKRFSGNYVAVSWDSKLEFLIELRRKKYSGWCMRKLYNIVYSEFRKWMQINDFVKLNWRLLLVADEKKREALRVKRRKSKHKPEKWNHLHSQLHKRLDLKTQGMRRMKGCKRVKWGCIVLDMILLWEFHADNKPQIEHEPGCYQVRDGVLPHRFEEVIDKKDILLQRDGIVKLVWKLLLAAVQRKRAKLKYMYMGWGENFLLSKTVRAFKDHGKRNKRSVKLEKCRMKFSEYLSVLAVTRDVFHSQRPPEQYIESWSAGEWSVVSSNCGRRVVSRSYDQTKLKLKQMCQLHLSDILIEEEHKSLYQPVLKVVSVVEIVDEALYFNQGTFHFPRPPELNQKEVCYSSCQRVLVQVESLCCVFNLVEINFPHDPGDTFQEKGIKSILFRDILLELYPNWSSDRRMIKNTAGQSEKLSEPAISQGRGAEQMGSQSLSKDIHFLCCGHS